MPSAPRSGRLSAVAPGKLRIYIGAAPGVGKTYAMLNEGVRRAARGADVVIGFVETHGRSQTKTQISDLPIVPRLSMPYRGNAFEEMDVDAVLSRKPKVVLVDDLAHTNTPLMRNAKRWQDVEEMLAAGIDVISTLNVQHLESLNDVVEKITGVAQRDTVPDSFVRQADQIELVDMSPEALRRRMAHGNIYAPDKVEHALDADFRVGNLNALRELALLWVADRVEDSLQSYLDAHGITTTWETRERVVVALTGAPGGDHLVRRAARMAGRLKGDLIGVHVGSTNGLSSRSGEGLEHQRAILLEMGGTYREVVGDDVAATLASFATAEQATQVVLGATRQSRLTELRHGSLVAEVQRRLPGVDVHIISTANAQPAVSRQPVGSQSRFIARPTGPEKLAWAIGIIGGPLLTWALTSMGDHLNLSSALLVNLGLVLVVSAVGGIRPGVFTAVIAAFSANYYLTPPAHSWSVDSRNDAIALVIFGAIGVGASALVDHTARRTREARRARADATALARFTGSIVGSADPLPDLVDQLRILFGQQSVAVLDRTGDEWVVNTASGPNPPSSPADGTALALDDDGATQLVLHGPPIADDDLGVLRAFADQLALGLEARYLRRQAQASKALTDATAMRRTMLEDLDATLRPSFSAVRSAAAALSDAGPEVNPAERAALTAAFVAASEHLDADLTALLGPARSAQRPASE